MTRKTILKIEAENKHICSSDYWFNLYIDELKRLYNNTENKVEFNLELSHLVRNLEESESN